MNTPLNADPQLQGLSMKAFVIAQHWHKCDNVRSTVDYIDVIYTVQCHNVIFCLLRGGVRLVYGLVSLGLHCFLRLERALCWRLGRCLAGDLIVSHGESNNLIVTIYAISMRSFRIRYRALQSLLQPVLCSHCCSLPELLPCTFLSHIAQRTAYPQIIIRNMMHAGSVYAHSGVPTQLA